MKLVTVKARLTCKHQSGVVQLSYLPTRQDFVTVNGEPLLVKADPQNRPILGCANVGLTIKPCTMTLPAGIQKVSQLVFIDDEPVCLDTITGMTDGTPPATIRYVVRKPGQDFVEADA